MVALAAIVSSKNAVLSSAADGGGAVAASRKRFVYYPKTLPRYLRKNPSWNLLRASALGAEIVPLPHGGYADFFGGMHGGSSAEGGR